MKKLLVVFTLIPALALAGVARRVWPEALILSSYRNATLTVTDLAGRTLQQPIRVTHIDYRVSVAAGTATGSMVIRLTDGTNNCDATFDCTTNDARAAGVKTKVPTGVCTFAAGAVIDLSVQTACGTAQPTARNVDVYGARL